jgi:hypothetical protein
MRCASCGEENTQTDRFCSSCGTALVSASPAAAKTCSRCRARLSPEERFCGECGSPVSTSEGVEVNKGDGDLFPLYGVTLGKTTIEDLARLGEKTTSIDKNTGAPYRYYVICGTNFWYNEAGIAEHIYTARGIYPIPEQWQALGFDWNISYSQWLTLLKRLRYLITVEQPPQIVEYRGHDSFSARILATKQPIMLTLDFNYNEGTTTGSNKTLYSINVKAP